MLFQKLYAPFLLLAANILQCTACATHATRAAASSNATYPSLINGSDIAADPATTAWLTNHFSLAVRDLNATIDFYSNVFGFRHILTFRVSANYYIAYLGHASGGKNGTGYQTAAEMSRDKNNAQGLMELQFYDNAEAHANMTSSTVVSNTFSHIGIVVPDPSEALARFERLGVNIVSRPGDDAQYGGPVLTAMGLGTLKEDDPEAKDIIPVFQQIAGQFIFVTDPDGNLIEVQPQNGGSF